MLEYMRMHICCCTPHISHTGEVGLISPCLYLPAMNALEKGRHAYIDNIYALPALSQTAQCKGGCLNVKASISVQRACMCVKKN